MNVDWSLVRRIVHLSTPIFLVYYFLPDQLGDLNLDKRIGLLLVLMAVLIFEAYRLRRRVSVPGMRRYESTQMSAAAWAAIGLTIAFLFSPFEYVAAPVVGMAFVDPLISKVRKTRYYPVVPFLFYLAIALTILFLLIEPSFRVAIAALSASVVAILIERVNSKYVDDDFLLIIFPLLTIFLILGI